MSAPWWTGLAPVTTTLECGGVDHGLTWADGRLHAVDHPDLEGDRTLAALGGDAHPCLGALDAWQRHHDDLRVLVYASRGPSDAYLPPDPLDPSGTGGQPGRATPSRSRAAWFMTGPNAGVIVGPATSSVRRGRRAYTMASGATAQGGGSTAADDDLAGLAGLLSLGRGFGVRLSATVAAAWADRIDAGDERARTHRPELHAAVFGRVTAAIREWLDDPGVPVVVDLSDGERAIVRSDDGYRVALPFRWLVEVWARDLAVVAGNLCLAATGPSGRLELRTVTPDLHERTVVIATS